MSVLESNLEYFVQQQCSDQWQVFLGAFAAEFGQQIPVAELRVLMARLGASMAQSMTVPAGNSISELEASINSIWLNMNWGWVALSEKDDGLYIEHHVSPLLGAFGEAALAWSPAILEGVYGHWLSALGASPELSISQVQPAKADKLLLVFRFGRVA